MKLKIYGILILFVTSLSIHSNAQLVAGNVFMKGNYVEIGIAPNQSYGSTVNVPIDGGYHPRGVGQLLGFVADPQKNGWTIGTPNYLGDYFLPGSPHEGWELAYDGARKIASRNTSGTTIVGGGISGSNTSTYTSDGKIYGIWQGTTSNMTIKKETILGINDTYFVIRVTLKNTSATTINNVSYARFVDADNEHALTGVFATTNKIESQPSIATGNYDALVSARGSTYPSISYLGLGARDCRATVFIMPGLLLLDAEPRFVKTSSSYIKTLGYSSYADVLYGIAFDLGNIPAGDSTVFSYAYILSPEQLDSAFSTLSTKFIIDDVEYNTTNDTLTYTTCKSSSNLDVKISNGGYFSWSTWVPVEGSGSTLPAGPVNSVPLPSDSITYRIIGNSLSCVSNDTMYLKIKIDNSDTFVYNRSICSGSTFTIGDSSFSSSGTYFISLPNPYGICDSFIKLNLTVDPAYNNIMYDTICEGNNVFGYTEAGTYSDTFINTLGCDSIRTFHLFVKSHILTTYADSICQGDSFHGYTTSGTFTDTFTAVNGCDSIRTVNLYVRPEIFTPVTLTLCQNELPYTHDGITIPTTAVTTTNYDTITYTNIYGCDSNAVINLVIHDTTISSLAQTICEGENYLGYTTSGIYHDTFTNVYGCDSVRTIHLTVNPRVYNTLNIELCDGDNYMGYAATGTYVDTFASALGCDSIRTLHLFVKPHILTTYADSICQGDSFHGYTTSGTFIDTFTAVNGCDSIRTVNLYVRPEIFTPVTLTLCQNELPYTHDGITIPTTAVTTTNYDTITYTNSYGCDSNAVINLVIHDTNAIYIDTILCYQSIINWNGIEITSAGTYVYTTSNTNNCDSVVRLNVIYTPAPVNEDEYYSSCGETVVDGFTFTTDTFYIDTIKNYIGCDSLYRNITVEVRKIAYDTIDVEICRGESYDFNGTSYNTTRVVTQRYTNDNGCDSFITLNLTVHALPDVKLSFENPNDICIGDTVILQSSGAAYYLFYDQFDRRIGTDNNADTVSTRIALNASQYYVIGTDEQGCSTKTYVTVIANDCCELVIPNAFSPNGDGLNDKFGAISQGHPEEYILRIFNRWGEIVYTSYRISDKWDGTINGKACETGTYYFQLSTKCYNGEPYIQKGEVILVR